MCFSMNQSSDLIRVCLGAARQGSGQVLLTLLPAVPQHSGPPNQAFSSCLAPPTNLSGPVFGNAVHWAKVLWTFGLPVSFLFKPNPGVQK